MADTPGKDKPSNDPKTTKSGPVKPPVLEGTARPASTSKPDDKAAEIKATDSKPPETKPVSPAAAVATSTPPLSGTSKSDKPFATTAADKPKPFDKVEQAKSTSAKPEGSGAAPWLGGVVGGVIGLGAAYGLAMLGLWPAAPQQAPVTDPRITQLSTAVPEIQTVANTVQDELATLTTRVGKLETSAATQPASSANTGASTELTQQLASLSERVDALAATPAAAPADSGLSDAVSSLKSELDALKQQLSTNTSQLADAEGRIGQLASSAQKQVDVASVARLPLILTALENAFEAGRPYETELAALRQAQPDLVVPEAVAGRAASGLPRPDDVARRLEDALPAMLAGRPADANGGWQDATANWFRGVIAMRPSGAIEGDGPDAIVARLEAAVAARDFAKAETEMEALPTSMRNAAGSVATDIATLAAADTFLADRRGAALNQGAGV